ncbi:uncharacterized protein LOC133717868 isoform X1 [Rosa rugosa]|uniref:uncharacterized protein LOC133717868 isoform X1 n=1 Tax=Rosa rugosa TaxID=74645 RepID=UPI002B410CC8|nr:uncharacterized protein LOC133717868 isoform X1 [Rosa rugosa]XP_062000599.1 uncharacterized protein LOC133717868 isoform X1 [Rosa rugosa]
MGSVALNFVGGIPFQGLYDVVKVAVHKSTKFKTDLINLEFTLRCLESRTLEQIGENNVRLNLPTNTVVELEKKMKEGKALVSKLSELSMWNIHIWGNCCNCIGPDYAKQLGELNSFLWSLVESLRLEQMRNITELVCLARNFKDRQDDMEKRQAEMEEKVDDILRGQQEIYAILIKQQDTVQRLVPNSMQQAPSSSRIGAANPTLRVVFRQLVNVVIQAKTENMMFERLLDAFKSTLYCLQPLIEEVAEHGRVVHLPEQEVEKFIIQIRNGVELVHKCSKVRKHANYRKYKFTDKIFNLEEYLFRLFIELKGQVERNMKEAIDSANNIEMAIKKIEDEDLCDVQLPELLSTAVGFDVLNMQGLRDVTEETLLDSASVKEEGVEQTEGLSDVLPELLSPADGLDVLNMQGSLDLITPNIQVVVTESEEIEVIDNSTRNVQEEEEEVELGHSTPSFHHNPQFNSMLEGPSYLVSKQLPSSSEQESQAKQDHHLLVQHSQTKWKSEAQQQSYTSKLLQAHNQVSVEPRSQSFSSTCPPPRRGRALRGAAKGRTRWSRDSSERESQAKQDHHLLVQHSQTKWKSEAQQQSYTSKLLQALNQVSVGPRSQSFSSTCPPPRRARAVREAADRVLAEAAKGRTLWSRAILTNRLKLKFRQRFSVFRLKKQKFSVFPLKWKGLPALQRKVRVLGGLVPGCRKQPLPVILEEATDYIAALEMQVRAMSQLTQLLSVSGSTSGAGGSGSSPPPS